MIQKSLMNILKEEIPGLVWSADFYALDDNTGTVYSTGGTEPDAYEAEFRYPTYQVYIRSSDWDFAKTAAYMVFDELHKKEHFRVTEAFEKDGQVINRSPLSRLGATLPKRSRILSLTLELNQNKRPEPEMSSSYRALRLSIPNRYIPLQVRHRFRSL